MQILDFVFGLNSQCVQPKMLSKMSMCGLIVILLGVISQVTGVSLTLDEDARQLCKNYKMMCKSHEVCAVQRFTEPKMTMPVCIPLSFVPAQFQDNVRNLVCRLPPEKGTCKARYIRWHFNIHHQGCTHFQYGGCAGNGNNFMTKEECESACLRTPTIRLIDGGSVKPAIMTAPEYKPPSMNKYEALNSVMTSSPEYDRFQVMKHRHRNNPYNEVSTRKRRRLMEKERAAKEKRRRERRKERRRLRKLKKRQRRKEKKRSHKKKKKPGKKNKKKKSENNAVIENETSPDEQAAAVAEHDAEIVEEAKEIVNKEIEELEEVEEERIKKEKRKERKRKKRRQRRKKRRLDRGKRPKKPKYAELRGSAGSTLFKRFQILDKEDPGPQANSVVKTT